MSFRSLITLYILSSLQLIIADTLPTKPGPFVSCGGIAVSSCPATSGCCTAGACCGSGCCSPTEMCVFPGTPQAGCCRFDDPTLCGSKTSTGANPSSSGTSDPNCVGIRTCTTSEGHWQCFLGRPCGFFYGQCGTCPALLVSSNVPSSGPRSSSVPQPSSFRSPVGSSTTSRGSSGSVPALSSFTRGSSTSNLPSGSSTARSSSSVSPSGNGAPISFYSRSEWKAMMALVPAYALAI